MQVVERMFCIETPEERYKNLAQNTLELIQTSGYQFYVGVKLSKVSNLKLI